MPPRRRTLAALVLAASAASGGCREPSCAVSDDPRCRTPSPCAGLSFACDGDSATVQVLRPGDPLPVRGLDALASPGDVVLRNGRLVAVIDAIDHPHYVAPTGGNLLDLAAADGSGDALTHMFQAVGLLPDDTVAYEHLILDARTDLAAVEVRGRLAGKPEARVVTRYELRPCEPGLRVRTEIVNGRPDPETWALVDAWYWSGKEALPFAPGVGAGFQQRGFQSPLRRSWELQPYFAAAAHAEPAMAYGATSCTGPSFGLHSEQLSAFGPEPRIVPSRDVDIFERFITLSPGRAVSGPIDTILEVRRQLFDEPYTELRGRVLVEDGSVPVGDVRALVRIEEGALSDPPSRRTPWTQTTVDPTDGSWSVRVPRDRSYVVIVEAFGREAGATSVRAMGRRADVATVTIARAAAIDVAVTIDGAPDHALVFVVPADDATARVTEARMLGGFTTCAPLLGSPTGGSPACDRVLVHEPVRFEVPPGRYDLVATAGPFCTVARETVEIAEGEMRSVRLALETLEVQPPATLSADFHVHGAASFDSTFPDVDRVQSFLAARVDVIAATDHDVVWNYEEARRLWDADRRLRLVVGLETTGHILFDLVPGAPLPQVVGHWNVWPLPFAPEEPYRGAPWDELAEPGTLFTRFVEAGWPSETGVIQLNHPWAPAQIGRDLGFPRAIGIDGRIAVPRTDRTGFDGTGPGLLLRTPPGARFGNGDYHAQEVMNGTENEELLAYRAYWFYLLSQGIIRAGTANSDSHTLVDNVVGTPRTLVTTDQTITSFDQVRFNRAVREGRMIGTNGPVIEASIRDRSGASRRPSTIPFVPAPSPVLTFRVTAAPWVPVDEVRIVVDGEVRRTLSAELNHPSDPFGRDGIVRFEGEIALAELGLDGRRDAWIVVEAGEALPIAGDLDCDGFPDTGDNDENGIVDWRDVDRDGNGTVDERDVVGLSGPPRCERGVDVGPIPRRPRGERGAFRWAFGVVTPHGYAYAFTNPFLLDWDGDGFDPPGIGGRG